MYTLVLFTLLLFNHTSYTTKLADVNQKRSIRMSVGYYDSLGRRKQARVVWEFYGIWVSRMDLWRSKACQDQRENISGKSLPFTNNIDKLDVGGKGRGEMQGLTSSMWTVAWSFLGSGARHFSIKFCPYICTGSTGIYILKTQSP